MASDYSTYVGNKFIRWLGGNAMPSAPAALWVALFNGNPKSGGTEVTTSVASAGRMAATFTVPASGLTSTMPSDVDVDFGLAENDVDISHFAIYDDDTAGNLLASDVVAGGPFSILAGAPVLFAAGDINLAMGS